MQPEKHYINRSGWLRAAVLGANDGILSTSSIVIGVAAASAARSSIVLAALAGLVAGAFSMAAGEYVSVSSQSDVETADLQREKNELETMHEVETDELAELYEQRGLEKTLATEVAIQLMRHNALEAHARDELGINDISQAKPLKAALASGLSFISGGMLPFLVSLYAPILHMVLSQYVFSILFLALSGLVAAKAGGSDRRKSILRNTFWGTVAMGMTALAGYLFSVHKG